MKNKIFIVLGVIVIFAIAVPVLYVRCTHAKTVMHFLETDYQIVYTFQELPKNVQKEMLADVYNDILRAWDETTKQLSKEGKISEEETQKSIQRLAEFKEAMSEIANPGERCNLSDCLDEPLPVRQLIYAGVSDNSCFIYYTRGGFIWHNIVAVYSLENKSSKFSFKVSFQGTSDLTINELKETVSQKPESISFHSSL